MDLVVVLDRTDLYLITYKIWIRGLNKKKKDIGILKITYTRYF